MTAIDDAVQRFDTALKHFAQLMAFGGDGVTVGNLIEEASILVRAREVEHAEEVERISTLVERESEESLLDAVHRAISDLTGLNRRQADVIEEHYRGRACGALRASLEEKDREIERLKVEDPCQECGGRGLKVYGDTSTWRGTGGGQTITSDVCDTCWGSRTSRRTGANLRRMDAHIQGQEREIERLGGLHANAKDAVERLSDLVAERDRRIKELEQALLAARDVLVAFQKEAGRLPDGGYSTTMTDAEKRVADAVVALDMLLAPDSEAEARRLKEQGGEGRNG